MLKHACTLCATRSIAPIAHTACCSLLVFWLKVKISGYRALRQISQTSHCICLLPGSPTYWHVRHSRAIGGVWCEETILQHQGSQHCLIFRSERVDVSSCFGLLRISVCRSWRGKSWMNVFSLCCYSCPGCTEGVPRLYIKLILFGTQWLEGC